MSRWRCRWYRRRLVDYADEVLPRGQQQRVEAHLSLCSACGEEVAALREVSAVLHAAAVPDRGDEFWRQQREAIGSAIRNARVPSASWWSTWWSHESWRLEWWRYPLAAAASVLIALAVYYFAASSPMRAPSALEEEFAALDTESLLSLRELVQTLVPADEQIAEAGADDDALLAALPFSDFAGSADVDETPQANDLSDRELDGLDTLVGDFG